MTTNRLELSRKRFAHVRKNQNVFSMANANIRELHLTLLYDTDKAHYVITVWHSNNCKQIAEI